MHSEIKQKSFLQELFVSSVQSFFRKSARTHINASFMAWRIEDNSSMKLTHKSTVPYPSIRHCTALNSVALVD